MIWLDLICFAIAAFCFGVAAWTRSVPFIALGLVAWVAVPLLHTINTLS